MKWLGLLLGVAIFAGVTGGAWMASARGWGLPGLLDEPVSVRQQSVSGRTHRGPVLLYFGGTRRHYGGGFHGGK